MARVSLEGITKEFIDPDQGEIVAVNDVDLSIEDGEFLVVVGPSGSGKSTMLRLVAGLESISDGEIYLDGEEISKRKPKDRDLAMVFQNYALYPHLTARDNIAFGLEMRGELSKKEIEKRVTEAAELMEIEELLDKMPNELSGGQQQRVSLGRAIVRNPKVFLMDEPLSNLDAKLRSTMRTEIQALQKNLDVTTIYVTHDQTEAMTMADRIAIMNHGELQQVASPMETFLRPANRFVAGFIGSPSMNFFDVVCDISQDPPILRHSEFNYETTTNFTDYLQTDNQKLILGIRPEDIEITSEDNPNSISATVNVIEPLGNHQLIYFELGGKTYTAEVPGTYSINEDSVIYVSFPPEKVHIFDRETEETVKNREEIDKIDAAEIPSTVPGE